MQLRHPNINKNFIVQSYKYIMYNNAKRKILCVFLGKTKNF